MDVLRAIRLSVIEMANGLAGAKLFVLDDFGFAVGHQGDDFFGGLGVAELIDEVPLVEHAAETGQGVEVVAVVLAGGEEEQVAEAAVGGAVADAPTGAGDDEDGFGDVVGQRLVGVRNGDACLQGGGAEVFTFFEGLEEAVGMID